jgi:transketolase
MNTSYLKIDPEGYLLSTQIRKYIIEMLHRAGSGHPGGSLSWVEIGNDLYLRGGLNYSREDWEWEGRDRFYLSKGHGVPTYYAIATIIGWLEEDDLWNLRKADMESPRGESRHLQGHPSTKTPGIEASTGSLGTGLCIAVGDADKLKTKYGKKSPKVIVLTGDGEHQTEELWPAVRDAGNLRLDNIIVYIDHNCLQIDGRVEDVSSIYPLKEKYLAYKWNVIGEEVKMDERGEGYFPEGHDLKWLAKANIRARESDKPTFIIANTRKGFGVSYMEDNADWHGNAPKKKEQRDIAIRDLEILEKECKRLLGSGV